MCEINLNDSDNTINLLDSPEFQEWFWDSKIIDENGKPLLVFHWSNSKFQQFNSEYSWNKSGKNRDSWFFWRGFYFTPHKNLSKKYWSFIYKCFLKVEKMLIFEEYHCDSRNFDPKKIPEEIKEDVLLKYHPLHEERNNEINRAEDCKKNLQWIASWWIMTSAKEDYYEDILSEVFREVLIEKWYQWVKWYNKISWEYEYVIFDPDDIFTFQIDILSFGINTYVKKSIEDIL